MSDFRFIKEVEITSGVTSVELHNVFNSNFDVYKVTLDNVSTVGTTTTDLGLRFIQVDGTVNTEYQYNYAQQLQKTDAAFGTQNGADTGLLYAFGACNQLPYTTHGVLHIFNPAKDRRTLIKIQNSYSLGASLGRSSPGVGVFRIYNEMSGISIYSNNSQPLATGKIRVYGYRMVF